MKDKLLAVLLIWHVAVLTGLVLTFFIGKITIGSYYLGMIGLGIWLTLINMLLFFFYQAPIMSFPKTTLILAIFLISNSFKDL